MSSKFGAKPDQQIPNAPVAAHTRTNALVAECASRTRSRKPAKLKRPTPMISFLTNTTAAPRAMALSANTATTFPVAKAASHGAAAYTPAFAKLTPIASRK